MRLAPGDRAPKFDAEDSHEHIWQVPFDFKDKKLTLVFLRHLGCPLCMRRIDELKKSYYRFSELGVDLMVIVQSTKMRVEKFAAKKQIPYAIVGDKEKKIYDLYGVERGKLGAFMAPRVMKESISATLKGYFHGPFEGDELQVPAEFIIGLKGTIEWAHYGTDISDSSSNEILFKELAALK